VHGPGIEFGVVRQKRWLFRLRASADRLFERRLEVDDVAAEEQSYLLRGGIDPFSCE
jgi:hypothetical protein